jgi:hypothetical protein
LLEHKGWNADIETSIKEIKRFLILKSLANDYHAKLLSPSARIDQTWHYLLQNPTEYTFLCLQLNPLCVICNCVISHNPRGMLDANRKERFERTLRLYNEVFKESPSDLFWLENVNVIGTNDTPDSQESQK